MLLRFALDGCDPFRRGGQCIAAQMHRCGAGMIRAPKKREFQPALADDGFHGGERQSKLLEHRTLFNVKFEIAEDVASQCSAWNVRGFNPNPQWQRQSRLRLHPLG